MFGIQLRTIINFVLKSMRITFATLRILGRAPRNDQIPLFVTCATDFPKHPTFITFVAWVTDVEKMSFFKIIHFSFVGDLSHGMYFGKFVGRASKPYHRTAKWILKSILVKMFPACFLGVLAVQVLSRIFSYPKFKKKIIV
jgi:hypothetical protein